MNNEDTEKIMQLYPFRCIYVAKKLELILIFIYL